MEDQVQNRFANSALDAAQFQKQIDIIKRASQLAQAKIDHNSAHSDTVLRSIEVVEGFLRKKHRICYGGQAINAYLPKKYKFYDPEYAIPDYDFFTPSQMGDLEDLVRALSRAGFQEISAREGMHEGTIKLYVDYIPVADITAIDPGMYRKLAKEAHVIGKITYIDPNSLRMLMYLELSRPQGEVERWPKVYERLLLFNEFVPLRPCHKGPRGLKGKGKALTAKQLDHALRFIVQKERIFAGGDIQSFYEAAIHGQKAPMEWLMRPGRPVVFYSAEPEADARSLLHEFQSGIKMTTLNNQGLDVIPSLHILHMGRTPLVIIVEQSACHSYVTVPLKGGDKLLVASMDTLITLFFSLGFVTSFVDRGAMACMANELVQLSIRARKTPESFLFPFISIRCAGHQTTMPSLIRAKIKRMTSSKKSEIRAVLAKGMGVKQRVTRRNR